MVVSSYKPSILSAQYNNVLTTPGTLSEIRGSGNFTTTGMSSNWSQTENSKSNHYTNSLSPNPVGDIGNQYYMGTDLNTAPFGSWQNDQFNYDKKNISSFPSASKESLKGDNYLQFGLASVSETPTSLNVLFFSEPNVKYISNRIVSDIYNLTGTKIKPQSENGIMIVMVNKYQYSLYGSLPSSSVVHLALPRGQKSCSMKERLNRLNQAVLQEITQQVLSGISAYKQYYKDASSMPVPLELPKLMTMKGGNVIPNGNIGMYDNGRETGRSITSYNLRNNVIN